MRRYPKNMCKKNEDQFCKERNRLEGLGIYVANINIIFDITDLAKLRENLQKNQAAAIGIRKDCTKEK